jgi:hypothetical protein
MPTLPANHRFNFREWLEGTTYPDWRRQQLIDVRARMRGKRLHRRHRRVKMFIKREWYNKFERPRGIYSRAEESKIVLGPIIKAIEKIVYKFSAGEKGKRHFVKHVPVNERPEFLKDMVDSSGNRFVVMDYTAFESSFTADLMNSAEVMLYKHVLQRHPQALSTLVTTITGKNDIYSRHFRFRITARRMSGEMNTSLGNGFANLMILLFWAKKKGITLYGPVVEGDDSLCSIPFNADTDTSLIEEVGIGVEAEFFNDFSSSSFCGSHAHPDTLENTTDPVRALLKLGTTHSQQMFAGPAKRRGLLLAKVLSLGYEYPRMPIIWALVRRFLFLLRFDEPIYERDSYRNFTEIDRNLVEANVGPPHELTREMFSRSKKEGGFDVSEGEQILLERYMESRDDPCAAFSDDPVQYFVLDRCEKDCIDYFDGFTVRDDVMNSGYLH